MTQDKSLIWNNFLKLHYHQQNNAPQQFKGCILFVRVLTTQTRFTFHSFVPNDFLLGSIIKSDGQIHAKQLNCASS